MINLIKSFIIGSLLVISIFSILPDDLQAERTPYCEEAYYNCMQRCDEIFPYPINYSCHLGCFIELRRCLY